MLNSIHISYAKKHHKSTVTKAARNKLVKSNTDVLFWSKRPFANQNSSILLHRKFFNQILINLSDGLLKQGKTLIYLGCLFFASNINLHLKVNFTNILWAAFMRADLKSGKRQSTQAAFCTLGSASVKAAHKHVDEIDPWR